MAETAPLLPQANRPPHDHPIFLRVCHSAWPFLGQAKLLTTRSMIAAYLTVVLALSLYWEVKYATGKQWVFEASNISLMVQVIYYWITAIWTMQHLMVPHCRIAQDESAKGGIVVTLKSAFAILVNKDIKSKTHQFFSAFYTAAVTFPFVITILYWLKLYSHIPEADESARVRSLRLFVLSSVNGINSVIALIEIMILSSVRKQRPLWVHVSSMVTVVILYVLWTIIGRYATKQWVYKYFAPDYEGWGALFSVYITLIALVLFAFFSQRGLHTLREMVTWKAECDRPRQNATAGQYWAVKKDGEEWPVVICDEEIVQLYFEGVGAKGARRVDGTWDLTARPGGSQARKMILPCLSLEAWNARHMQRMTTNATLADAWQEVRERYERFGDTSDLGYWIDKILASDIGNGSIGALATRSTLRLGFKYLNVAEKRERKLSPNPRYFLGSGDEEFDDEESDAFATNIPKIKKRFSDANEDDVFATDLTPSSTTQSITSSKLEPNGRFTPRLGTPFGGYRTRLLNPMHGIRSSKTPSHTMKQESDIDHTVVQVFVGDPHRIYKVGRQGLDASPLLSPLLVKSVDSTCYVMSPLLSSLDADAFLPIAEYLGHREYSPKLLDDGTERTRLEVDVIPEERGQEIVRSERIYSLARILEIGSLQDLAFRKLKVLASLDDSFPLLAILTVVEHVFADAKGDLRQYLIHFLADTYWPLMVAETAKMAELLQASKDLAKGVFTRLSEKMILYSNVKGEDGVKSEETLKDDVQVKKEDAEKKLSVTCKS
ncbi:MAG: hypothetical protein Q9217_003425 [Psora testacea]